MRILHILDHSIPLHSGYTFRTRSILEQQRAIGWQTYHITSAKHKGAALLKETVDGLDFYRTPQPQDWLAGLPILNQATVVTSLSRRLDEVIKEIKPDILHAHSPALNGIAAVQAGKRHSIPVVYECRAFWEDAAVDHGTSSEWGLRYRLTRALETYVFKRVEAVTTICEGLRRDIIDRGIAENKVTVIPNAVDIEKFQLAGAPDPQLKQTLGLQGVKVLGFIGSFYAYEGLSLLIDAMSEMLQQRPDLKLLLVGGGPQDDSLKAQTRQLGLTDKVIFTGRVPHDMVSKYYDQIDLLVYPRFSMRLTELVTPLKPLEAMAQGRLVVASDVGGHKELITDGQTGWLFKANDAHALAQTVLGVLSKPDSWPAVKNAGRRLVEQERNWKSSVSRYQKIYETLIAQRQS